MPLIILHGPEYVARKEAFEKLRAELDTDGALATNMVMLDAKSASPQEVMAACDTVPFLGDVRLVVVEGVLGAAVKPKRATKKKAADDEDKNPWAALVEHIDQMPTTTTLVLMDDEAPATGLLKQLAPKATRVQSFAPPNDKDLARWVMDRSKEIGLKIDPGAARLLAELIGAASESRTSKNKSHIGMLANEMEKLAAYANGETVRADDVRLLVSRAKEHKGWELADAVVEGKGATAAQVMNELIEDGQPMPVLLAQIAGRYRRIAIAKDMTERGESSHAVALELGMKPGFGVEKLIDQAQRHSWDDLRRAYARIIQAERDVKGGLNVDERVALDVVVQELAMGRPRAAARR